MKNYPYLYNEPENTRTRKYPNPKIPEKGQQLIFFYAQEMRKFIFVKNIKK